MAGQQVRLGAVAVAGHAVDALQAFAQLACPDQSRTEQPRHRQIVRMRRFHRPEHGDRLRILAEAGVAIRQQRGDARIARLRGFERVELFGRLAQRALLVIRQRQVESETRIVFPGECGLILDDGFVVASQLGERCAEIGAHLDGFRIELQEFLVFADGQRIVALLLCRHRVPEELLGAGGLRAGGDGGDDQCHDAHRFQDSGVALW